MIGIKALEGRTGFVGRFFEDRREIFDYDRRGDERYGFRFVDGAAFTDGTKRVHRGPENGS